MERSARRRIVGGLSRRSGSRTHHRPSGGRGRDILPHKLPDDFQLGVVSTDVDCAAGFVEPYLGQLVFLLDSCNHFEFHLISDRICKRPVFAGKSPVQDR